MTQSPALLSSVEWKSRVWKWAALGLVLHLIAAIFSTGYYHTDEHFQILEFLSARLGLSPMTDLPIEFHHEIRPWLQPLLYGAVLVPLKSLGLTNPFAWATAARVLSSLMSWAATILLSLAIPLWIPGENFGRWRSWALRGLWLIWFMPALHARHSSENLGGAFLAVGLALLAQIHAENQENKKPGLALLTAFGLCLGLSFEFRYQLGFCVLGALVGWIAFARPGIRALAAASAGLLVAGLSGILADRWGYGHWVFAPWNYFHFNLIEGRVNAMDTQPWWDFLRTSVTEAFPVLGLLTLLGILLAWVRNPRHPLTWGLAPLYLVHSAIGHKELRFLFPLLHFAPILIAMALLPPRSGQWPRWFSSVNWRGWIRPLGYGLWALNLLALLLFTTFPAWTPVGFFEKVYDDPPPQLHYLEWDPYILLGTPLHFYRPPGLERVPWSAEAAARLKAAHQPAFIFYRMAHWPQDFPAYGLDCAPKASAFPSWIQKGLDLLGPSGIASRVGNWTEFECRESKKY